MDSSFHNNGLWLGGRKVNGNWEWADGSIWDPKYTNWEKGSPKNSSSEGAIRTSYNKWRHRSDNLSWFICQYKL